jgi:hypothetical protein
VNLGAPDQELETGELLIDFRRFDQLGSHADDLF